MSGKTVHPNFQPHQVEISHDGCNNWSDKPFFSGTYDECVQYLRDMPDDKWNRYIDQGYEFEVVNLTTKRVCSYVL